MVVIVVMWSLPISLIRCVIRRRSANSFEASRVRCPGTESKAWPYRWRVESPRELENSDDECGLEQQDIGWWEVGILRDQQLLSRTRIGQFRLSQRRNKDFVRGRRVGVDRLGDECFRSETATAVFVRARLSGGRRVGTFFMAGIFGYGRRIRFAAAEAGEGTERRLQHEERCHGRYQPVVRFHSFRQSTRSCGLFIHSLSHYRPIDLSAGQANGLIPYGGICSVSRCYGISQEASERGVLA